MSDILSERAELSFTENVLEPGVIPLCSAMAAKEEGDARYALDLLKNAGELAFDEDSDKVTSDHVKEQRIKSNTIRLLKSFQHCLFSSKGCWKLSCI